MTVARSIIEVLSALLTPTIAVVATYIAYQQHRTNKLKVRADLYDRRMDVFNAVTDLLGHIGGAAAVDLDQLRVFLQKTRESYFLFGNEIPEYLDKLYSAGVTLRHQTKKLFSDLPVGPERDRLADENGALVKWFLDQFDVAQKKFGKYLRLQ
jgi:CHASE3 domain sensor protein